MQVENVPGLITVQCNEYLYLSHTVFPFADFTIFKPAEQYLQYHAKKCSF